MNIKLSIRDCGSPMDESNSIARSGEEFDISSANSNSVAILILSLCNLPTLQCGHNLLCHSSAQIFYGHTFVKPRYAPKMVEVLENHVIRTYDGTTTKLKMAVVVVKADRNVRK